MLILPFWSIRWSDRPLNNPKSSVKLEKIYTIPHNSPLMFSYKYIYGELSRKKWDSLWKSLKKIAWVPPRGAIRRAEDLPGTSRDLPVGFAALAGWVGAGS
jgi:hypothetical protein